ncbi:hypothetical protein [Rufibacter ruber]|uniref:hypothetical protein n=1 Tax=Rufibacter ruber TaxID=1783499 RepID=UPI0030C70F3B
MVHPNDPTQRKTFQDDCTFEDLLVPVFQKGKLTYTSPSLLEIQERAARQVALLHETYRRFLNPHIYKVGLEAQLHEKKMALIVKLREEGASHKE